MNPRKQRFYIAAAGVLAVIALLWSVIGSPVVLWRGGRRAGRHRPAVVGHWQPGGAVA